MSKFLSVIFVGVICFCSTFAQSGNSDRCEVTSTDAKTRKSTKLGQFTTVIGEENLTTRAFRLPRTKLFIVASVFYTDESLASKSGQDSISMELTLSVSKKRDVLRSLSWADAEMPLNPFEVGRVTMLAKVNGSSQLITMECSEGVRVKP